MAAMPAAAVGAAEVLTPERGAADAMALLPAGGGGLRGRDRDVRGGGLRCGCEERRRVDLGLPVWMTDQLAAPGVNHVVAKQHLRPEAEMLF